MFLLEHDELASAIGAALTARSARVAVVETTAGGLIAARMVSVPGASGWFEGGATAYSRASKIEVAADAASVLDAHGAVSAELVRTLAEGMRGRCGVEYAVAESGIAGPQDGRRSSKTAGTAFISVAGPDGTRVEEHAFTGTRVEVMTQIAERALEMLREALEG